MQSMIQPPSGWECFFSEMTRKEIWPSSCRSIYITCTWCKTCNSNVKQQHGMKLVRNRRICHSQWPPSVTATNRSAVFDGRGSRLTCKKAATLVWCSRFATREFSPTSYIASRVSSQHPSGIILMYSHLATKWINRNRSRKPPLATPVSNSIMW